MSPSIKIIPLLGFIIYIGFRTCHCNQSMEDNNVSKISENEINSTTNKGITPEMISSDVNEVKFFLYPKYENPKYMERLLWNVESVKRSGFNSSLPVKILIHGFMSNSTDDDGFIDKIKNAYLQARTPANLIAVDWGKLSTVKDRLPLLNYYPAAVRNVQIVGKVVGEFLIFLIANGYIASPEHIHLVGFSLGAHVSGVVGYTVLQNTSIPVNRISGLDPAGPAFKDVKGRDFKLDSTDANFVDVTHTNQNENGYSGVMGHADFYPNGGGPNQPGCLNATEPVKAAAGICAHGFAYRLFAHSITSMKVIRACKCDSSISLDVPCGHLDSSTCQPATVYGEDCPQRARGKYYFRTDDFKFY